MKGFFGLLLDLFEFDSWIEKDLNVCQDEVGIEVD